jgi:hypothetical protein
VIGTEILSINRDGTFSNPDFLFFDTLRVYYQVKSKLFSSSGASFMESKLSAPSYVQESKRFMKSYPFNFDSTNSYHAKMSAEAMRQLELMKGNVMETVTVKAKAKTRIQEMEEKYTNGLFRNSDGYQFDLIDDPLAFGRPDVFNYLQGKVAGLQINSGGGMDAPQVSWRGSTPDFFLDERQVDIDLLQNIPIDDIAYIKVFRPPFVGASFGGAGGAIAVYTRRGGDQKRSGGGLSSNTITGFAPLKEFYSPNYGTIDKRHENKDLRTTLYWNSMLKQDGNKIKFNFYNNDVTKAFRVIVQGFTREGLFVNLEQVME